jgi:hypothetical protein
LKRQNAGLRVVAIDHLTEEAPNPDRDRNMAVSLQTKLRESPDDTVTAVLIGNFHNRRRTPSDTEWKPNFLSFLGGYDVLSLAIATSGGSAWVCETAHHCNVTLWQSNASSNDVELGGITLLPQGNSHYDGHFFIGEISPSLPAVRN